MTGIILAAGKSTRMNSDLPKVLLPLNSRPLLFYILKTVKDAGLERIIIVVGKNHNQVMKTFPDDKVEFARQKDLLGTADAVKTCEELLHEDEEILVCYGDTPLITAKTIKKLIETHRKEQADATILTTILENPFGYGRIVRDELNQVMAIVEEKEATDELKKIKEINSGAYIFNWKRLAPVLNGLQPSPRTGEYYLTDTITGLKASGAKITTYVAPDSNEILGVNTPEEFDLVAKILAQRKE